MSSLEQTGRIDSFDTDIVDESSTDVKADLGDLDDFGDDVAFPRLDDEISPRQEDEDRDRLYTDELDTETLVTGGFDSDYDPVDRFFEVQGWQRRLTLIQRRLSSRTRTTSFGDGTNSDNSVGIPEEDGQPHEFSEILSRASDTLKVRSKQMAKAVDRTASHLKERTNKVVKDVDQMLKESRSEVEKIVEQASGTLRKRGEKLKARRQRLGSNLKQGREQMRQNYKRQMEDMRSQLDKVMVRSRSAKFRQMRHMICFCCAMMDLIITAYWLGAFPHTHHYYHTFKFSLLVGMRAVYYRCQGMHYYLYDLCYYINIMLLVYIWVFPTSDWLFMGCHGFSGVLLISVIVFRNSLVPHSLDRVTSLCIHISPAVQMWAIRWYCKDSSRFILPERLWSPLPSMCLYAFWCIGYYANQFIINRKRIERKKYETLYSHLAYGMGMMKALPKPLQTPIRSRIVFIVGHFGMFAVGLPFLYFPFALHTAAVCLAAFWAIKNGATFYITYFWKVYNDQITAFERQIVSAQADAAAQEEKHSSATNGATEEDVTAG